MSRPDGRGRRSRYQGSPRNGARQAEAVRSRTAAQTGRRHRRPGDAGTPGVRGEVRPRPLQSPCTMTRLRSRYRCGSVWAYSHRCPLSLPLGTEFPVAVVRARL